MSVATGGLIIPWVLYTSEQHRSDSSVLCFEVKCSENLVLLLSEAFIPLKRVSFSIEIAATISTSLLFRTEAYSRFVSSKLKHFKHNLA